MKNEIVTVPGYKGEKFRIVGINKVGAEFPNTARALRKSGKYPAQYVLERVISGRMKPWSICAWRFRDSKNFISVA